MSIISGHAIQVIPSDLGTLIALDRDTLEAAAAEIIQEDTDFVQGFDFQCEVIDNTVSVNKGRIRKPVLGATISYATETIFQTTLSEFLPEEEGDVFIEIETSLSGDQASVTNGAGGVATFDGNQYNYAAGIIDQRVLAGFSTIKKGVMPPSEMDFIRIRLAEYSVNENGVISLTQTHFGPVSVPQPTQNGGFAIFFRIV